MGHGGGIIGWAGKEAGVPPLLSTMNVVVVDCSPRRIAEASVKSIVVVLSVVVVGWERSIVVRVGGFEHVIEVDVFMCRASASLITHPSCCWIYSRGVGAV